ncbi:hypothetical protein NEMIN01_0701 [Nematocida minor]|uniref:uncharacterized protein n=1 Tax=Nematocida minor TaxID=1912983 RepID=UPI00221E978E|nr:uncharacterized protein NEMIN01_0701 [Nematocida minor]KAI5189838.1 hypothetical protein NEMIN01_0701 [Nematocida minor]
MFVLSILAYLITSVACSQSTAPSETAISSQDSSSTYTHSTAGSAVAIGVAKDVHNSPSLSSFYDTLYSSDFEAILSRKLCNYISSNIDKAPGDSSGSADDELSREERRQAKEENNKRKIRSLGEENAEDVLVPPESASNEYYSDTLVYESLVDSIRVKSAPGNRDPYRAYNEFTGKDTSPFENEKVYSFVASSFIPEDLVALITHIIPKGNRACNYDSKLKDVVNLSDISNRILGGIQNMNAFKAKLQEIEIIIDTRINDLSIDSLQFNRLKALTVSMHEYRVQEMRNIRAQMDDWVGALDISNTIQKNGVHTMQNLSEEEFDKYYSNIAPYLLNEKCVMVQILNACDHLDSLSTHLHNLIKIINPSKSALYEFESILYALKENIFNPDASLQPDSMHKHSEKISLNLLEAIGRYIRLTEMYTTEFDNSLQKAGQVLYNTVIHSPSGKNRQIPLFNSYINVQIRILKKEKMFLDAVIDSLKKANNLINASIETQPDKCNLLIDDKLKYAKNIKSQANAQLKTHSSDGKTAHKNVSNPPRQTGEVPNTAQKRYPAAEVPSSPSPPLEDRRVSPTAASTRDNTTPRTLSWEELELSKFDNGVVKSLMSISESKPEIFDNSIKYLETGLELARLQLSAEFESSSDSVLNPANNSLLDPRAQKKIIEHINKSINQTGAEDENQQLKLIRDATQKQNEEYSLEETAIQSNITETESEEKKCRDSLNSIKNSIKTLDKETEIKEKNIKFDEDAIKRKNKEEEDLGALINKNKLDLKRKSEAVDEYNSKKTEMEKKVDQKIQSLEKQNKIIRNNTASLVYEIEGKNSISIMIENHLNEQKEQIKEHIKAIKDSMLLLDALRVLKDSEIQVTSSAAGNARKENYLIRNETSNSLYKKTAHALCKLAEDAAVEYKGLFCKIFERVDRIAAIAAEQHNKAVLDLSNCKKNASVIENMNKDLKYTDVIENFTDAIESVENNIAMYTKTIEKLEKSKKGLCTAIENMQTDFNAKNSEINTFLRTATEYLAEINAIGNATQTLREKAEEERNSSQIDGQIELARAKYSMFIDKINSYSHLIEKYVNILYNPDNETAIEFPVFSKPLPTATPTTTDELTAETILEAAIEATTEITAEATTKITSEIVHEIEDENAISATATDQEVSSTAQTVIKTVPINTEVLSKKTNSSLVVEQKPTNLQNKPESTDYTHIKTSNTLNPEKYSPDNGDSDSDDFFFDNKDASDESHAKKKITVLDPIAPPT